MMRNFLPCSMLSLPIVGLMACGEQEKAEPETEVVQCDLSLDELTDSEWLFLREINGQDPEPDAKSRLKFVSADGKMSAKYTAGSLSDMYDYSCDKNENGDQFVCRTEADIVQWCQTLMSSNRKCNMKTLHQIDDTLEDSEKVQKGIEEAGKLFKEAKAGESFTGYKRQFNSLNNKLQGVVYVSIDQNNCRLNVIDHYVAYVDKKRQEDSNPNGNNAFVKNELGDLQWEDCETPQIFDTTSEAFPEKPEEVQPIGKHAPDTKVTYWVLHEPLRYAEDGCTYTYDVFYNYKKVKSGLTPEVVEVGNKKENRYSYTKHYKSATKRGSAEVVMTTHQIKCEGKPEKKITTCNKVIIR